jgi:hypothetical protein
MYSFVNILCRGSVNFGYASFRPSEFVSQSDNLYWVKDLRRINRFESLPIGASHNLVIDEEP